MGVVVTQTVVVVGALIAIALGVRFVRLPRWLRAISIDQWRAIDAETVRTPDQAGRVDVHVLLVLLTVAAVLTLQEYIPRGWRAAA